MNKNQLRSIVQNQRTLKNNEEILQVREQIFLLAKHFLQEKLTIAFYHPIKKELDLRFLWEFAWTQDIQVLLPKVISKTEITFCDFNSYDDLQEGYFNILEPITQEYKGKIDIIFVPGLAFDKQGARLGYGAGYYDRFLQQNPSSLKIGVCYHDAILESIPKEKHDIAMDFVLSEHGLYSII